MKFKTALFSFIILLIINVAVFLNRQQFLYTKQVSYNGLYPKVSALAVKDIFPANDSNLQFELLHPPKKPVQWHLGIMGKEFSYTAQQPYLLLQPGLNYYTLRSDRYRENISASVEYIPAAAGEHSFIGMYKTNTAKISAAEVETNTAKIPITPAQQILVNKLLKDSLQIISSMPAEEKAVSIGKWLYKKIYYSRGAPSAEMLQMNPYDAYHAAFSGKKIWCGIYAMIFDMFASQAGLKCRLVEIKQDMKNVTGPVHEFNEYFSPEKGQWIAADMMFNNIYYLNAAGEQMNGVQVKNASQNDPYIQVLKAAGDILVLQPFNRSEPFFFDLYGRDKELFFYRLTANEYNGSMAGRLENYVSQRYWYEFYSDTRVADNRNFYLKQMLLILLLISAIFTGAGMLKKTYVKNDRI